MRFGKNIETSGKRSAPGLKGMSSWLLLCCLSALCFAGEVVIDDFSEPAGGPYTASSFGNQDDIVTWTDTAQNPGTLGHYRDGAVRAWENEWWVWATSSAEISSAELWGQCSTSGNPDEHVHNLYLSYDGNSGWANGPDYQENPFNGTFSSPVDLTDQQTNDEIEFTFTGAGGITSPGSFFDEFRLTIRENEGENPRNYSRDLANGNGGVDDFLENNYAELSNGEARAFTVSFDQLSGASFDDIEAIHLQIRTSDTGSFSLGRISTVPEPGLSVCALLAALSILVLKRPAR